MAATEVVFSFSFLKHGKHRELRCTPEKDNLLSKMPGITTVPSFLGPSVTPEVKVLSVPGVLWQLRGERGKRRGLALMLLESIVMPRGPFLAGLCPGVSTLISHLSVHC